MLSRIHTSLALGFIAAASLISGCVIVGNSTTASTSGGGGGNDGAGGDMGTGGTAGTGGDTGVGGHSGTVPGDPVGEAIQREEPSPSGTPKNDGIDKPTINPAPESRSTFNRPLNSPLQQDPNKRK